MTFDVVTWQETTEALLNWITANPDLVPGVLPSDLSVGSLERAQVEAFALALEQYYFRTHQALEDAIAESCYKAFGFRLLPGTAAVGSVVFAALASGALDIPIPLGTLVLSKTGERFTTVSAGAILAGQLSSDPVPLLADKIGTSGNVTSGAIAILPYPLSGVDYITNPTATMGGTGEETTTARALRFSRYIRTLPRGTAPALEYAAASVSGVVAAKTVEPFLLPVPPSGCPFAGLVWLWCDTGVLGDIDVGVKSAIQVKLNGYLGADGWVDGWKAAGVVVVVRGVTRVPVKVTAAVLVEEGARARFATEIAPLLTQAALQYFSDLQIGDPVVHNALLVALAGVDSDIIEIALKFWATGDAEPLSDLPADLPMIDDSDPDSTGKRPTLDSNTYVEGGASMAYPYWSLA